MLAERITSLTIDRTELTPFPTHSSELFVATKNINVFRIKQIHTLAPKHPGYGYPQRLYGANGAGISAPLIDFYAPCFHGLTKPFSSNLFPFTSIQNGGRARGPASNQTGKASDRSPTRKMRNLQGGTRATYGQPLIDSTQRSD